LGCAERAANELAGVGVHVTLGGVGLEKELLAAPEPSKEERCTMSQVLQRTASPTNELRSDVVRDGAEVAQSCRRGLE
jgi:hypothetical protein